MPQQVYKLPQRTPKAPQETQDAPAPVTQDAEATAKRDADIDAILDEIDGVLEVNAEAFVSQYVQEGGQ